MIFQPKLNYIRHSLVLDVQPTSSHTFFLCQKHFDCYYPLCQIPQFHFRSPSLEHLLQTFLPVHLQILEFVVVPKQKFDIDE